MCAYLAGTNKRGNVPVFLAVVLSALVSATLMLVFAAREDASISVSDGALNLAGSSVLSEFNYEIQKEYGLFLIEGTDDELSRKLKQYAGYTISDLPGVSLDKCSVSGSRFSVANVDLVHDQIIFHMKFAEKYGLQSALASSEESESKEGETRPERTLGHGPTIVSLPSRLLPDKSIVTSIEQVADKLTNPGAIFRSDTNKYLVGSYMLGHFNSYMNEVRRDHFFRNEVEYILAGTLSDEKNSRRTGLALEALFMPSNLAHIYGDPEKVAAVTALAEVITPGILGTVTQAGISAAWAAAESVNDVKLLKAGYHVPLAKGPGSWAIEIDNLVDGIGEEYIRPDIDTGLDYNDYMRILLFFKDANITTARIMDLIQINTRMNYNGTFLIQECSTGIDIDARINRKNLSYEKTY